MDGEGTYISRERRSETGVTPEYLDSTRASPLNSWSRPRDPSRPRCPLLPMPHLGAALSLLPPSAYLLSFLRGFCLRWKGNHGASRVTGPTVFFSSRGDPSPSHPIVASLSLSLLVSFLPDAGEPEVNSSSSLNDKIVRFCQLPQVVTGLPPGNQHSRDSVSVVSSVCYCSL